MSNYNPLDAVRNNPDGVYIVWKNGGISHSRTVRVDEENLEAVVAGLFIVREFLTTSLEEAMSAKPKDRPWTPEEKMFFKEFTDRFGASPLERLEFSSSYEAVEEALNKCLDAIEVMATGKVIYNQENA